MAKANPIEIQKDLKGIDYPATKDDILKHAKKNGADKNVQEILKQIPDQEYAKPTDVNKAIGDLE
ncbi:DUF2795 domain-containing protein [Leptolyngbya ohadii]|uniref:DUF2795 domain-containing protein n=1 Tax=Leptolyngbya ohadii TaxID=1962290 RepID=UPI000B5A1AD4|nr:DUF2795 domain-containing protein [Leptolyngbya ohadii]